MALLSFLLPSSCQAAIKLPKELLCQKLRPTHLDSSACCPVLPPRACKFRSCRLVNSTTISNCAFQSLPHPPRHHQETRDRGVIMELQFQYPRSSCLHCCMASLCRCPDHSEASPRKCIAGSGPSRKVSEMLAEASAGASASICRTP